jgi:hypothetical protein
MAMTTSMKKALDGEEVAPRLSLREFMGTSSFYVLLISRYQILLNIFSPPCHAGGAVSRGRMAVKLEHLITVTQITHQLAR